MAGLPEATRVLVVGAHPDDPDFFCAGSVARWTAQGAAVHYLVVTSGDKGTPNLETDVNAFCRLREAEQAAAACVLGVEGVSFLRLTDGEVLDTLDLRGRITAEIRRFRPDLILTHDPLTRVYRMHPDHRAVGAAMLAAAFPSCRLPTFFPEQARAGLQPHVVNRALLFGSEQPDTFVDISAVFDRKVEALERHVSQVSTIQGFRDRVRRRAEEAGRAGNVPLAEAFLLADLG